MIYRQRLTHLHADGEHGVERAHRVLQDHRDPTAADLLHLGVGLVQQIVAVEEYLAADDARGRTRDQADDTEARHALAGARLANQPERLRLAHGKGHAVHRLDRAPAGDDVGLEDSERR